jgi:hypothetical protein
VPALKRPRGRSKGTSPGVIDALFKLVFDLGAIAAEMVAIPLRAWMRVAEVAGAAVLAAALAAWPPLVAIWRALLAGLRVAERVVTPARATAVVALFAAFALAASQYTDYRAVRVGDPEYQAVQSVAPAPEVDKRDPRNAHGDWLLAIAAVAVMAVAVSYRGRWRVARLLLVLGVAALAVAVLHDHDTGLRAGQAGLDYQGAKPVLLDGYWAEIVASVVLALCGPLLALHLAREAGRAAESPSRRPRSSANQEHRPGRSRPARASS